MAAPLHPQTEMRGATLRDRPFRLTLDRYHGMITAGILGAKDRVFLWKGQLVAKMGKGRSHVKALTKLYKLMVELVPEGWYVEQEQPIQLGDDSEPEPDLTVIRGTPDDYPDRSPTARDVALIVEVADSSLAEDQGEVLEAYAAAAIPIYWIANLRLNRIEVHGNPTGPADRPFYRVVYYYTAADEVPVVLDGREVGRLRVRDILT